MANSESKSSSQSLIMSYLSLRIVVGILSIILPIVMLIGSNLFFKCNSVQESISAYYHTAMRDIFVGIISAISVFLFTYKHIDNGIFDILHLISAALLFLMLAYFSFFLFTKSSPNPTSQKLKRNVIYRVCGILILICIVLLAIYFLYLRDRFPSLISLNPIFWLETVALWSFGVSWLTKGEMILKDLEA